MKNFITLAVASTAFAAVLAPSATAQAVAEVPAMTVTHEVFDGDLLAPQPAALVLADINAATLSGNSLGLANIMLTPSTAALGLQSTNVYGQGLALDPAGSGSMMAAALGESFQAFDASLDLGGDSTEIGFAIADWVSTMTLDFYSGGVLVTTFNSTAYSNIGVENHKYFQMTGGTFDRVDIRASSAGGNWAISAMSIESTGPAGPALAMSCAGGVVTADFSNCTPGGPIAIVYGSASAYVHGGNQCNGIALDLTPSTAPLIVSADAAGAAQYVRQVNPAACGSGILVQGVDAATCTATNSAAL